MMRRAPRTRAASDSRLLVPLLLSALLLRADACSSNSDCSENAFCSTSEERCKKCWQDWTDAEINACCEGDDVDTFRAMSCADHLDQEFETSSRARCEAACEREDGAGIRYTYYEGPASWSDARAACQARGGDLAMPRNAADDAAAFKAVGPGKRAYIGLSDRGTEGTFVWVDGEPAGSYLNWGPSEPNGWGGHGRGLCGLSHLLPFRGVERLPVRRRRPQ